MRASARPGGARQGTPGTAYPQRTDLQSAEPVTVAKSQNYGERAQQQAAQRAVPIAGPQAAQSAAQAAPQASPSAPPTQPPTPPAQSFPPAPPQGPGVLPWMHPTARPNEPVTAGLPTGPGPGPESMTGIGAIVANQAAEQGSLKNLLSSLANAPASSSAIRDLAAVAGA